MREMEIIVPGHRILCGINWNEWSMSLYIVVALYLLGWMSPQPSVKGKLNYVQCSSFQQVLVKFQSICQQQG